MSKFVMCAVCRKAVQEAKVGAKVEQGGSITAICLKCWDNDPRALLVYQVAGLALEEEGSK